MDNSYFNGMISPLIPLPLSGVVFYQKESNSGSPTGYAEKINVCFNAWRNYMGS
ncbi:MAG: sialate O-acetylesterase [Bacteroidia bacterium]|jgi:sialate O-acetylesterase